MRHRILVVEDHRSTREGIIEVLDKAGFLGIPAATGAKALEYLKSGGATHAILLDLMMPELNGWTFRRAQLKDPWLAEIPVIVITGLEGRPLEGLGATAVFKEAVDLGKLGLAIRRHCERL